jgi:threonine dehydrogenase-like Zn-dependent dehydrogenase
MPGRLILRKELLFVWSFCYGQGPQRRDFDITAQMIHQYLDTLEPLVTQRFTLDEVAKAFETAADKTTGSIKAQIEP